MTMRLFAQITKVDEAKRLVYGRACQEVVDRSGEIFDYESSKPYFKAWSEGIAKDTDGKSLGNVRAMHGKVSAGKLTAIDFNDADKAVDICSKIVDDNEWAKTMEGCYTGFSIGGSYVGDKKTEKIADKDVVRYTANPTEISLVDQPCVPTAKFFDIVKADGVIAKVAFKETEPVVSVKGTDEQVQQLGKLMGDAGLDMAAVLAIVKAHQPGEPHPLIKAVNELLASSATLTAEIDAAKGDAFDALVEKQLTADEIAAVAKAAPGKMVKGLREAIIAKGSANHTQKIHDMLGEMGARCAKVATGDLAKGDMTKLQTELAEAQEAIKKLQAQPVPYVTLRAVVKGDAPPPKPNVSTITLSDLKPEDLLKSADGSIDYLTSLEHKREKLLAAAGTP